MIVVFNVGLGFVGVDIDNICTIDPLNNGKATRVVFVNGVTRDFEVEFVRFLVDIAKAKHDPIVLKAKNDEADFLNWAFHNIGKNVTYKLARAGIKSKQELEAMTDAQLLRLKGVGFKALQDIRRAVPNPVEATS